MAGDLEDRSGLGAHGALQPLKHLGTWTLRSCLSRP